MNQNGQPTRPRVTLWERVRAALAHRHLPIVAAVLAVALALPSLGAGWLMDDYFQRASILRPPVLSEFFRSPIDMFRFLDGDPDRTGRLMDIGILPWWTFKQIKAQFWRPVTVLTHWLDYRLWPDHPALMHAQSVLWFGGLAAVVALLYRRVMGPTWVAGAAALLYAVDDARGLAVGWLAGRNALPAAFFGVCALLAHDRWRRNGSRAGAALGTVLFAASLLSAEAGIATCAYLAAYAVVLDPGTWRNRCLALIPYAAVVVAWRITWGCLGYGVSHIGLYIDPIGEPLRFAVGAATRAPILLLGQWAAPPSETSALMAPDNIRWLWLGAVAFLALLAGVLAPLLRHDRLARFWALGMVLAVVPVCATFPADRLLIFVGIGAMPLLAGFLGLAFGRADWRPRTVAWRVGAVSFGVVFIIIHAIAAPVALALRAGYPLGPKRIVDQYHVHTPMDDSVERQDVIIVNAPSALHAGYLPMLRELDDRPVPRHTRTLAPGVPSVVIRRPDARTLVIRPADGYLTWIFDRLFRSEQDPMALGQQVALTGMTVEVTGLTDDGRPAEATFRFAVPLEDPSLRWLHWRDGAFVPFTPPPIGRSVELRAHVPFL